MWATHKEARKKGVESMSPLTFITVSQEQKQMLLLPALPTVLLQSFYLSKGSSLCVTFILFAASHLLPLPTLSFRKSSTPN